jgi:hypothetical protein
MPSVARFSLGRVVLRLIAMLSERAFRYRTSFWAYSDHAPSVVDKEHPQLPVPIQHTGANEWTNYVP